MLLAEVYFDALRHPICEHNIPLDYAKSESARTHARAEDLGYTQDVIRLNEP